MRLHVRLHRNGPNAGAPEEQFRDPFVSLFERLGELFPFQLSSLRNHIGVVKTPVLRPYWRNTVVRGHVPGLRPGKGRLHRQTASSQWQKPCLQCQRRVAQCKK